MHQDATTCGSRLHPLLVVPVLFLLLAAGAVQTGPTVTPGNGSILPRTGTTVPGAYMVKFKASASDADLDACLCPGPKKVKKLRDCNRRGNRRGPAFFDSLARVEVDSETEGTWLARVRSHPSVEYVEPEQQVSVDRTSNDPRLAELWGMTKIQAPQAWDLNIGSHQVVVGVIDTGVEYTHPDLAANMWTNGDEIAGNGRDDDANGYVDDVYGADFINDDGDPRDDHFHGTHVSGTIGGVGNNGTGVVGVNWNVKIMALKFLGASGAGNTGDAVEAIQYAIANGAHILSNSWGGGGYSQALQDAITAANNAGLLFVAAGGNENSNAPAYPAAMTGVVAVAATDQSDLKASFSNYGSFIDIAAPGVGILSTTLQGGYQTASGTSMACPHTAGLAALIKSRNLQLTKDQIQTILQNSADDLGALGRDDLYGYGRINAYKALSQTPTGTVTLPTVRIDSPRTGILNTPTTVRGTAAGSGFASWKLELALPGATTWTLLNSSSTPVTSGSLGVLTPLSSWPEGILTLRLTVRTTTAIDYSDSVSLRYLTSTLRSPTPYTEWKPGNLLTLTGTAGGPSFLSYSLAYGSGESPTSWIAFRTSALPISDGTLGTLTIPTGTDGFFTIRLSVQVAGSTRISDRTVWVDGKILSGWPVSETEAPWHGYSDPLVVTPIAGISRLFSSYTLEGTVSEGVFPSGMTWYRIRQRQSSGLQFAGWPPYRSSLAYNVSMPAVVDLDKDGTPEIVVTNGTFATNPSGFNVFPMDLTVFRPDGTTRFTRTISPNGMNQSYLYHLLPVIEDLNQDGFLDILVGGPPGKSLQAYDRNGTTLAGFPVNIAGANDMWDMSGWPVAPAVGDLDNDGKPEIVFWLQTTDEFFHLKVYKSNGTAFPMTKTITTGVIRTSETPDHMLRPLPPLIGDVTGDGLPDIVAFYRENDGFGGYHSVLGAWRPDGNPCSGWPIRWLSNAPNAISQISIGDLTGDQVLEIVASGPTVTVYNGNGSVRAGWPVTLPAIDLTRGSLVRHTEPLVADIDGDGKLNVVVKEMWRANKPGDWLDTAGTVLTSSRLYAFHDNGSAVAGFPRQNSIPSTYPFHMDNGAPTIADFNADGKLDLVVGSAFLYRSLDWAEFSAGRIKVWPQTGAASSKIEWGKYRGNVRNTGRRSCETDPRILNLTLTPATAKIPTGSSLQFTATAKDQCGLLMPGSFTWTATGGTISSNGLYTAPFTEGTYTVRVTMGLVTKTASVTVEVPRLTSILITPGATCVAPGYHRRFTAEGKDQFGNSMTVFSFSWSATGGSIDATGRYTAPLLNGSYTVTARSGLVSGNAGVTVHTSTKRGDMNGDGNLTASDIVMLQNFVFLGTNTPAYMENADCNDDKIYTSSDVVMELNAVFLGTPLPPVPPGGTPIDE